MREGVQEFLIKSHTKVAAHYQQVLRDRSIPNSEREAIEKRLVRIKAELQSFSRRDSVFGQEQLAEAA